MHGRSFGVGRARAAGMGTVLIYTTFSYFLCVCNIHIPMDHFRLFVFLLSCLIRIGIRPRFDSFPRCWQHFGRNFLYSSYRLATRRANTPAPASCPVDIDMPT